MKSLLSSLCKAKGEFMFKSSEVCPKGNSKNCNGKQQKNADGKVLCVCASCAKTKKRLLN